MCSTIQSSSHNRSKSSSHNISADNSREELCSTVQLNKGYNNRDESPTVETGLEKTVIHLVSRKRSIFLPREADSPTEIRLPLPIPGPRRSRIIKIASQRLRNRKDVSVANTA
jgi:hypothetical protein